MRCLALMVLACCLATSVAAQEPEVLSPKLPAGFQMPDSAAMGRILANSTRAPAEFVLGHRDELALTADQIREITALGAALRDSAKVRMARMLEETGNRIKPRSENTKVLTNWEGAVDEEAIRADACASSAMTADVMLNMMRDRIAVGALLTAGQRAKLSTLSLNDILNAMKPR